MHSFPELVDRCTSFTLNALRDANEKTMSALQISGATHLVKTLQMVQLQRVISAVGMFSLFDAMLQEGLSCADGFREATNILDSAGEAALKERFCDFQLAINVLKHGRGRSYSALVAKAKTLSFKLKLPNDSFFNEGDVSEVSTLIEVDDVFVHNCAKVIQEVSAAIRKVRPDFLI